MGYLFDANEYASRLCLELGLKHFDMWKILNNYNLILKHDIWVSQRSNRGLLVDCVYLYCKKEGLDISIEALKRATKKEFGVSTQARPSKWCDNNELQFFI